MPNIEDIASNDDVPSTIRSYVHLKRMSQTYKRVSRAKPRHDLDAARPISRPQHLHTASSAAARLATHELGRAASLTPSASAAFYFTTPNRPILRTTPQSDHHLAAEALIASAAASSSTDTVYDLPRPERTSSNGSVVQTAIVDLSRDPRRSYHSSAIKRLCDVKCEKLSTPPSSIHTSPHTLSTVPASTQDDEEDDCVILEPPPPLGPPTTAPSSSTSTTQLLKSPSTTAPPSFLPTAQPHVPPLSNALPTQPPTLTQSGAVKRKSTSGDVGHAKQTRWSEADGARSQAPTTSRANIEDYKMANETLANTALPLRTVVASTTATSINTATASPSSAAATTTMSRPSPTSAATSSTSTASSTTQQLASVVSPSIVATSVAVKQQPAESGVIQPAKSITVSASVAKQLHSKSAQTEKPDDETSMRTCDLKKEKKKLEDENKSLKYELGKAERKLRVANEARMRSQHDMDLRRKYDDKRQEFDQLKERYDKVERQKVKLEDLLNEEREARRKMQSSKDLQLQDQIEKHNQEMKARATELENLQGRLKALEQCEQTHEDELNLERAKRHHAELERDMAKAFKQKLLETCDQLDEVSTRKPKQQAPDTQLQERVKTLERVNKEQEEQLVNKQDQNNKALLQLEIALTKKHELKLTELDKKRAAAEDQLLKEKAELRDDCEEIKKRSDMMYKQWHDEVREKEAHKTRCDQLQSLIKLQLDQLTISKQYDSAIANAQAAKAKAEEACLQAQKARDAACAERESAIAQLEKVRKEIDDLTRQLVDVANTNDAIIKQRDQSSQDCDTAIKSKNKAIADRDKAVQDLQAAVSTRDAALKARDEAIKATETALKKHADGEHVHSDADRKQINDQRVAEQLRKNLAASTAQIDKLEETRQQVEWRLTLRISEAESQLETSQNNLNFVYNQFYDLQMTEKKKEESLALLQSKFDDTSKELAEKSKEIALLKEQLTRLKKSHSSLEVRHEAALAGLGEKGHPHQQLSASLTPAHSPPITSAILTRGAASNSVAIASSSALVSHGSLSTHSAQPFAATQMHAYQGYPPTSFVPSIQQGFVNQQHANQAMYMQFVMLQQQQPQQQHAIDQQTQMSVNAPHAMPQLGYFPQ